MQLPSNNASAPPFMLSKASATAVIVMTESVERPSMAEKLKLPEVCGQVARSRKLPRRSRGPPQVRSIAPKFQEGLQDQLSSMPASCNPMPRTVGRNPRHARIVNHPCEVIITMRCSRFAALLCQCGPAGLQRLCLGLDARLASTRRAGGWGPSSFNIVRRPHLSSLLAASMVSGGQPRTRPGPAWGLQWAPFPDETGAICDRGERGASAPPHPRCNQTIAAHAIHGMSQRSG